MADDLPPLNSNSARGNAWANVALFALSHPLQTLVCGLVALVLGYSAHAIRDAYLTFDSKCSSPPAERSAP